MDWNRYLSLQPIGLSVHIHVNFNVRANTDTARAAGRKPGRSRFDSDRRANACRDPGTIAAKF